MSYADWLRAVGIEAGKRLAAKARRGGGRGEFAAASYLAEPLERRILLSITPPYAPDPLPTTLVDSQLSLATGTASLLSPAFSNLTGASVNPLSSTSFTASGTIAASGSVPPASETVAVKFNGVTVNAPIAADGTFSATFNTTNLPASPAPYRVVYSYAGDATFAAATDSTTTTVLRPPAVVQSINRTSPAGTTAPSAGSVTYTVTFSGPVTGVDPTDFALVLNGVATSSPLVVSPSGGPSTVYTVTANGLTGNGTLGLNLVYDGTIVNALGNPIAPPAFDSSFAAQQTFLAGAAPYFTAVADLNADGKPDLIVANNNANTVSVLLGNGNGTFAAQTTYAVGSRPASIAVADVNADGRPDLIVGNGQVRNMSVLLGSGTGTFAAQATFNTASTAVSVAVADVNGDGKPDVLVAGDVGLSFVAGNGDGTFATPKTFAAGQAPVFVAVADVNGDGKADLVAANYTSNTVSVLLGNGNGTFGSQTALATGTKPRSVAVSDINGDGQPDLLVANSHSYNVSVLLGTGAGTFAPQKTLLVGSNPYSVAVSDVNGDGQPDLVVANEFGNNVGVLLGSGDGNFAAQKTFLTGVFPHNVVVSDVNGDGRPDLVVDNSGAASSASVLLGTPSSPFVGQAYTVTQAPATLALSGLAQSYDGTPKPVTVTTSPAGLSTVTVTYNGSTTVPTNAGSYNVVATLTNTTYAASPASGTLVVGKLSPTFSNLTAPVTHAYQSPLFTASGTVAAGAVIPTGVVAVTLNGTTVNTIIGSSGNFSANFVTTELRDSASPYVVTYSYAANTNFTAAADNTSTSLTVKAPPPVVESINRTTPSGPTAFASGSVTYTVTFSEPVTGVDPSDFALSLLGVTTASPLVVSPSAGFASVYSVTVNGIAGLGALGLNLTNDGTIVDALGVPLSPPVGLAAQQTFATGSTPVFVAAADVNGDARPDLLVANVGGGTVGVLLGNGNGTFAPQQTFNTGSGAGPYSIAVADVNGDGKPDLLVVNEFSSNVGVLLGNGNGTFAAEQTFATGSRPRSVVVSDVNGDGRPDLVVANFYGSSIGVLLGTGTGTFAAQQTFATAPDPFTAAVADFNGDGKPDVVVCNEAGSSFGVSLGLGNGTFAAQQTFATGSFPISLAVADFNGDGKQDVAVTRSSSTSVGVFLGNGSGGFAPQQTFNTDTRGVVAAADINGDGRPDLVVSEFSSNAVSVLIGNGDGTFAPQQVFACPSGPSRLAIADLNADGRPDVIDVSGTSNALGVMLATPLGVFAGQVYTAAPVFSRLSGALSQPFGTPLFSASGSIGLGSLVPTGSVSVTLNGSAVSAPIANDGTFTATFDTSVLLPSATPYAVKYSYAGDTNFSAAADNTTTSLTVVARPTVVSIKRTTPGGPTAPTLGSVAYTVTFNQPVSGVDATDFKLVLGGVAVASPLVVSPASGPASVYTVTVNGISGLGTLGLNLVYDGTIVNAINDAVAPVLFDPQQTFSTSSGTFSGPYAIVASDLNADGIPDLVAANVRTNSIAVLIGHGDGTFAAQKTYATATGPRGVTVADLNGDGKPDLIVANRGIGNVGVFIGNGDGTFAAQKTFSAGGSPYAIGVADMNGDGNPDLVVANNSSPSISLLLGSGTGTFVSQSIGIPVSGSSCIAVTDINGDGKADILVSFNGGVGVMIGNGNGTFKSMQTFTGVASPRSIAVADVNADGRPDVVTADSTRAGTVSVMLGNGDGTFAAQRTFSSSPYSSFAAVSDVDGDGRPDIVVTSDITSTVEVLPGNGDGTFAAQRAYVTGQTPKAAAVSDVNGDGLPDLVVANYTNDTAGVFLGAANDSTGQVYTITQAPATLALGGLGPTYDGAPKPVVLTTNPASLSGVTVTYNGSLTPPTNAGTYSVAASLNNINYAATPAAGTLVIAKASPQLTNLIAPTFLAAGAGSFVASGKIAAGVVVPPGTETIAITVNGVTANAPVAADGSFSAAFDPSTFAAGSYPVSYSYGGDANFNPASDGSSTMLTINPAGLTTGPGASYTLTGPPGSQVLQATAGVVTLGADLSAAFPGVSLGVGAGASVFISATQHLAALTLTGGGTAALAKGGAVTLVTGGLSITGASSLDLVDDHLVVNYAAAQEAAALSSVTGMITSGLYNGPNGFWDGPGLDSSSAALDGKQLHGLGIVDNNDGSGNPVYPTFGGQTVGGTSILVGYTLFGDADLNGVVNPDDFTQFLAGFHHQSPVAWLNGDFDYNGVVNADDFTLLLAGIKASQGASSAFTLTGAITPAPLTVSSAPLTPAQTSSAGPITASAAQPTASPAAGSIAIAAVATAPSPTPLIPSTTVATASTSATIGHSPSVVATVPPPYGKAAPTPIAVAPATRPPARGLPTAPPATAKAAGLTGKAVTAPVAPKSLVRASPIPRPSIVSVFGPASINPKASANTLLRPHDSDATASDPLR